LRSHRLVQCTYNGTTTTNTYASDGLRHRSVVGANTTDYVLDQTMQVRELLNGMVKATYLVGPRGPEYRRDDQAGTIRWYVYDGLGSVVGEVAPDGTLTRSQSFDVYGCVRTSSGTATTKHKFVGSLGHPSDDETGLIYMRARHYDPVCGRFVSEDPARHGISWFMYCYDNPVMYRDCSGKEGDLIETEATTDINVILDNICARVGYYLRCVPKIGDVTSQKAIQALIKLSEDPSAWRCVVAEIGGDSSGFASVGWMKAIVCIAGRSAGAYLAMELETHPIPYGQMTGLAGL
jgi:RHS repeat-associated protein